MKRSSSFLLIIVMFCVAVPDVGAVQLGGLLKRAKNRAEDKVQQLAEREAQKQIDQQVDKLVENMWNGTKDALGSALENALPKSKTTVDLENNKVKREGLPDLDLAPNQSDPVDAEFVSYTEVSIIHLPEQLAPLMDRFGNATVREVYQHGARRWDGTSEYALLVDNDDGVFYNLDLERSEYWSMNYDEMFQMAGQAIENINGQLAQASPGDAPGAEQIQIDVKVTPMPAGRNERRGLDARQNVVVVETEQQGQMAEGESAKMWVVLELWTAENYAGSTTLNAFDQKIGEQVVNSISGSGLDASLDMSAFGDPRFFEGMQEAQDALSNIEGLPIEQNTYFILTGKDVTELDLESIMTGSKRSDVVGSQVVLMSMESFVSNLTADTFDESKVSIPESFTEIENPLKAYLEGMNSAGDEEGG